MECEDVGLWTKMNLQDTEVKGGESESLREGWYRICLQQTKPGF